MAEARINREIAKALPSDARGVPRGSVCKATLAEWDAFQQAENQKERSSCMELIEGDIYIVERPTIERETFISEVRLAIACQPAVRRFFKCCHGPTYNSNRIPNQLRLQADESYGPRQETGSLLPQGIARFGTWHTLVVEVGHARTWGTAPGLLDWKAQKWTGIPGVRYVLCVAITDNLTAAEYKLYTVERQGVVLPDLVPEPIVSPRTELRFDARELLGL